MKLPYGYSHLSELPSAKLFKDLARVVKSLKDAHYNSYDIDVILTDSALLAKALGDNTPATYNALTKYLAAEGIKSGSKYLNERIMEKFGKRDRLEYNDKGQVCHRGTMPGNPQGGSILVAIGTPLSCDPTSETYWSM